MFRHSSRIVKTASYTTKQPPFALGKMLVVHEMGDFFQAIYLSQWYVRDGGGGISFIKIFSLPYHPAQPKIKSIIRNHWCLDTLSWLWKKVLHHKATSQRPWKMLVVYEMGDFVQAIYMSEVVHPRWWRGDICYLDLTLFLIVEKRQCHR